jgi:hypothetical protein
MKDTHAAIAAERVPQVLKLATIGLRLNIMRG